MENESEDSVTYIIDGDREGEVRTVKYVDMPDSELIMYTETSDYALAVWTKRLKNREASQE
jgi:hypothetical protein